MTCTKNTAWTTGMSNDVSKSTKGMEDGERVGEQSIE